LFGANKEHGRQVSCDVGQQAAGTECKQQIRQDRKELLNELGIVWTVERSGLVWRKDDDMQHYRKGKCPPC
jgi:hypothetical protein